MKKFSYLYIFAVVQAAKSPVKFCDGSPDGIEKSCFIKETLLSMTHSANQIAIDNNDSLYFSYDSGEGVYVPVRIKIGTADLMIISGIKDAFAIACDRNSGLVYFGGSHGIYKLNPTFASLKKLAAENLDIWWIVVKDSIYFLKFPSLNAYRYVNRTLTLIPELRNHTAHQFIFDMDNNLFFINNTGLYGIKNKENDAIVLREYPRFVGMTTDNNGFVYVCGEDGIFTISKMVQKVKKVLNLQGVLGMTFDKDNNLVYTTAHEIVRLIPVTKSKK